MKKILISLKTVGKLLIGGSNPDSPIKLTPEQLSKLNALNSIKDNIAQYRTGLGNIEALLAEHDHLDYVIFRSEERIFQVWQWERLTFLRSDLHSLNERRSRILECLEILNGMLNPDWQFVESDINLDAAYAEVIEGMYNDSCSSDLLEFVKSKGLDPQDYFVPLSVKIEKLQDKLASTDPDAETEDRLSALSLPRRMRNEPAYETKSNDSASETKSNVSVSETKSNDSASETIQKSDEVLDPFIKQNNNSSKNGMSWDLYNKTFNKSDSSKQEKNKSTVDFTIEKQETEMPDYFDDID